jgi:hypothetical protein
VRVGFEAPVFLMINDTNEALVVTNVDTSQGTVTSNLFDGPSPQVGDIVYPGERYRFNFIEYFFGSNVDVTFKTQDGSGTVRTRTGFDALSGWGYGCDHDSGAVACADPGTNPNSWQNNVEIVNR